MAVAEASPAGSRRSIWVAVIAVLAVLAGACSSSSSSDAAPAPAPPSGNGGGDENVGTAERQSIEVEGGSVSVLVDECGEGPGVMLLHGARFQGSDWFDLGIAQALCAGGSDVVAVDLPGNGQTAAFEHDQAPLLQELVEAFPGTALIVAPSMSGGYLLPWSTTYPSDIVLVPVAPVALEGWSPDAETAARTHLVWGSADSIIPLSLGEETVARTGAELEVIGDAGHAPYVDEPEVFISILEALLEALPA